MPTQFTKLWPYAAVFLSAVALDWVTALAIRYTADQSPLAVLFAVLLTGFWWVAVRAAVQGPWYLAALVAGAALGTAAGITWPP